MAFEKLFDASSASPFKFEKKGDTLEGYYMGSFDHHGDYGTTKKHIFDTKEGPRVVFGQRNLVDQLPGIKVGTMVLVTYTSDRASSKKGFNPTKLYLVQFDKENVIEVSGVNLESTDAATEDFEESSFDDEAADEVPAPRAAAPAAPAKAPSASSHAKVQELLNRSRANR